MKKLQLMKHIAGELVKGTRIVKGKMDGRRVAYTDGYVLWIIREKDDIFSDNIKEFDANAILHEEDTGKLEPIDHYIVIDGIEIMKGKKLARGVINNVDFYFNIDLLKYFDKNCKLYKLSSNPCTPIYIKDENGTLEGLIMPVNLSDSIKKNLDEKLGL